MVSQVHQVTPRECVARTERSSWCHGLRGVFSGGYLRLP